jgi:hypothetical protein
LGFHELIFEACASAKGYNRILSYHDDLHDALECFIKVFFAEGEDVTKHSYR